MELDALLLTERQEVAAEGVHVPVGVGVVIAAILGGWRAVGWQEDGSGLGGTATHGSAKGWHRVGMQIGSAMQVTAGRQDVFQQVKKTPGLSLDGDTCTPGFLTRLTPN